MTPMAPGFESPPVAFENRDYLFSEEIKKNSERKILPWDGGKKQRRGLIADSVNLVLGGALLHFRLLFSEAL